MLGLQEARSPGTPSTKTYSCVACSATFSALASLLVHQATHASEISDQKAATLPTCSHCSGLFASQELLQKHHCMVLPLPVTQDVHKCDCGEEFDEFSAIEEHKKKVHENEPQVKPQLEKTTNETSESNETFELAETDSRHSVKAEVPSGADSPSISIDESHQNTHAVLEVEKKDCISASDLTPVLSTILQEDPDEGLQTSNPLSLASTEVQDHSENEVNDLKSGNTSDSEELMKESQESSNKKSLLKMLASAYMSSRQPVHLKCEQSKRTLPPRKVSPRAPIQAPAKMSGNFINQLRQKMAAKYVASGPSREGFRQPGSMLNVNPCKKKKKKRIVSTTRTLYPVVALETCQKLVKDNIEGEHQCGVCRRVFHDVDSLIMHHALHKKERVKFCRRCRQYVISVFSVPINHVCSTSYAGTLNHFPFLGKTLLTSDSPTTPHSQKLFHCPLCKRSYTRRHNLNKHNCQWIATLKNSVSASQKDDMANNFGEGCSGEKPMSVERTVSYLVNVGVNTRSVNPKVVKTEEISDDEKYPSLNSVVHSGSAKSFPPFVTGVSKLGVVQPRVPQVRNGSGTESSESVGGSQWTVPLDDTEIDVMEVDAKHDALVEAPKENSAVVMESNIKCPASIALSSKDFQVHISDGGIKRFSCNRCQKSYSRRFTVKQHLKICGAGKLMEQHFGKANIIALKKRFPCPNCGVSFTRKDNMNMHRKRCQLKRTTNTLGGDKLAEKKQPTSHENMFVLPPVSKNNKKGSNNNSENGNWAIMSLPSVLPRKVTCECGTVFTCPRLLFEHLQMHALESYICSYCGENLNSWADFEAHQRLHEQNQSYQKIEKKGLGQQQPDRQSPLQQSLVQSQRNHPQDLVRSRLNHRPLTETCVCHRCKKIFRRRKSLLRHLRLSCRGDIAGQKKHSCTRCGMIFQSPLAHKVHVQGNTCTPSFKPIRCPVCVRWFSGVDGLKRHLVSHSQQQQQQVLTCQICAHKCSSQEDLEEHERIVHFTKEASESLTIQSAHVSQSNPSNAFHCQICQRSYPKLQSLKDHLRKVHRPKSLNLVSVGANAPKDGGLQSSSGISGQTQSKKFQCNICASTYPDFQTLKNHRRKVHRILGKPSKGAVQQRQSTQFQCHICSRVYTDWSSLRNHRRRVHRILGGLEMFKGVQQSQDNPYWCQICQRSYPDVKSLKNHRRRVHRILGDVPESAKIAATNTEQLEINSELLHVSSSPSTPETPLSEHQNLL